MNRHERLLRLRWVLVLAFCTFLFASPFRGDAGAADDLDGLLDDGDPFKADAGALPALPLDSGPPSPASTDLGGLDLGGLDRPDSAPAGVAVTGSFEDAWCLLHALAQRVRSPGARVLDPIRVKALETGLRPLVESGAPPLSSLARTRLDALLVAAASGAQPSGDSIESALDGSSDSSAQAALGEAASSAFALEEVARRKEDRFGPRLDALIYGPLAASEVVQMLGSADEKAVSLALAEIRCRGADGLAVSLISRLGDLRPEKLALRVVDAIAQGGGDAERRAFTEFASAAAGGLGGVGAGPVQVPASQPEDPTDLDVLLPSPVAPSGFDPTRGIVSISPELERAAIGAAGRIQGRLDADATLSRMGRRAADLLSEEGQHHYAAGESSEAAECFRRAEALDQGNPVHAYNRARALYRSGLFVSALAEAAKAVRMGSPDRRFLALELGCLRALGRTAEVQTLLADAGRSAESGSLRAYIYGQTASEQLATGRYREALESLALAQTGFVAPEVEARHVALEALALEAAGQKSRALSVLVGARDRGLGGRRLERVRRWVEAGGATIANGL